MITAMTTVLTVLALTALLALVLRQLEANHRQARTGVAVASGAVALDRDAVRVQGDLSAAAPARLTGRRMHSQPRRLPSGRGVARLA
jgi:hypothetical protein